MADNYLEKKMEEHRAGSGCSSASYRPRLTPRGNRPGVLAVDFIPCEILIEEIDRPGMTEIARELAAVGFKVCFTLEEIHRGTKLAATLGCRFLPPSLPPSDDAIRIKATEGQIVMSRGKTAMMIDSTLGEGSLDKLPPQIIKTVVWMASMLANLNDFQENVLKNIKIEGFSL